MNSSETVWKRRMANLFSLHHTAADRMHAPKTHFQDSDPHCGFRPLDLAPADRLYYLKRRWKRNQKKSMIHPLPAQSLWAKDNPPAFLQTSCPTPNIPLGASSHAPCTTNSNFS